MRGRMPQYFQSFAFLWKNWFDFQDAIAHEFIHGLGAGSLRNCIKLGCEINFHASDLRGQSFLGEIAIKLLQRFSDGRRAWEQHACTTFKLYAYLAHLLNRVLARLRSARSEYL